MVLSDYDEGRSSKERKIKIHTILYVVIRLQNRFVLVIWPLSFGRLSFGLLVIMQKMVRYDEIAIFQNHLSRCVHVYMYIQHIASEPTRSKSWLVTSEKTETRTQAQRHQHLVLRFYFIHQAGTSHFHFIDWPHEICTSAQVSSELSED